MDAERKINHGAEDTAEATLLDIRTISDHFPGIGRYTYQLACALARQRHRGGLIFLANPKPGGTRFNPANLTQEPRTKIIYSSAAPFSAAEQLRLPGTVRRLHPKITHYPYSVLPYAAPGPIVLTVHDIIPIRLPQFFSLRRRFLYRASLALALHKADAVICVSEATRADLLSMVSFIEPPRVSVVHEGVGEEFRTCNEQEVEQAKKKYGLPKNYLLYVGSNKPHKNLSRLIDAYSQLRAAPELVITGPDGSTSNERLQTERLGIRARVRLTGAIPEEDLPALYSGARAFVFPSLYEGFGLPPLEAMACGTPVACSDIPSLRETTANGAVFFDPADCRSIAHALEQVLEDENLRVDLRMKGVRRAAELSWDAAAQKTLDVYERAMNSRRH